MGWIVGFEVGPADGNVDGSDVDGTYVGLILGAELGDFVGPLDGDELGLEGPALGLQDGRLVGLDDGVNDGR